MVVSGHTLTLCSVPLIEPIQSLRNPVVKFRSYSVPAPPPTRLCVEPWACSEPENVLVSYSRAMRPPAPDALFPFTAVAVIAPLPASNLALIQIDPPAPLSGTEVLAGVESALMPPFTVSVLATVNRTRPPPRPPVSLPVTKPPAPPPNVVGACGSPNEGAG